VGKKSVLAGYYGGNKKPCSRRADSLVQGHIWVLGNPSMLQTCLVRPFICDFRFPGPLNPPLSSVFVGATLCLPILSEEVLVFFAESRCLASLLRTDANGLRSLKGAVIACSSITTIEPFCAVRCTRCPLANNKREIRSFEV
jgi:hypothetical protein